MEFFHCLLHIVSRQISRCFSPRFVKSALSPPSPRRRDLQNAKSSSTCALLHPPTFFFKIRPSDLTSRNWHDILIVVDGALAQLVAHNTGSVGVRSSNLLCSTKPKKSELHPDWGWVRISSFYGIKRMYAPAIRRYTRSYLLPQRCRGAAYCLAGNSLTKELPP